MTTLRHLARLMTLITCLIAGSSALAAGYSCVSVDGDLQVVVDMASPEMGQAVQLITFIDPSLSARSRVVASFAADHLQTESRADAHRFIASLNESQEKSGKRLGGTKIGLLENIVVEIQTITRKQTIQSLTDGSISAAQITYLKKSGEQLTQDFDCALFLGDDAPGAPNDAPETVR